MNDDVKAINAGAFGVLTLVIIAVDYKGFDGIINATGTPAFSPDGKMLAFNQSGDPMSGGGATLSVLSFDHSTYTFSNERDVATNQGTTVAWPAFSGSP